MNRCPIIRALFAPARLTERGWERWHAADDGLLLAMILWLPLSLLPIPDGPRPAEAAPDGFTEETIASLDKPTALAFTPDERLLITTKSGELRIFENGNLQAEPALDLSGRICDDFERGLLGVAVDPEFGDNGAIYLFYTFKKFGHCARDTSQSPVNRVSRFTLNGNSVRKASETVLVDNMPSPHGNHNAGDLHFGNDGYLYISIGDGGCDLVDRSRCAAENQNARRQHILTGKILRITRQGGIPATNPYQGQKSARCAVTGRTKQGNRCQETFATGLRNPFRIAFDPNVNRTRFFINDVGQKTWEEIDEGKANADYGWNIREGFCANSSANDCGSTPSSLTDPVFAYKHDTGKFSQCGSITGGAFVPRGIWPAEYDGAYLFSDFVCGNVYQLTFDDNGNPSDSRFADNLGKPVVMIFGPYQQTQALYYTTFINGGEVRRLHYSGSDNRPPITAVTADPTAGSAPLTVAFDASGSRDLDGDQLSYAWDFLGDGSATASGANANYTYEKEGRFTATVTVTDGHGGSDTARVRIDAGNSPPQPEIQSPGATQTFAVGEKITLRGAATDTEDGELASDSLSWEVRLHHNNHFHPYLDATEGNTVTIVAPAPEDLDATEGSYLEIRLTATDSDGVARTETLDFQPAKVALTFETDPAGLELRVNSESFTAPTTMTSWEGYKLDLVAPEQSNDAGQAVTWTSWSDGGRASHRVTTPGTDVTYTATFTTGQMFEAGADARVMQAKPDRNFGRTKRLKVDGGQRRRIESFVRFRVQDIGGPVESATLRLFVPANDGSGTSGGPSVFSAGNRWTERGITWNSRPKRTSSAIATVGRMPAGEWVEYDVSDAVTGNGTYTFVLAPVSRDGVVFSSREGHRAPQLIVTTE